MRKFYKYTVLSITLIFSGACTDKFEEINTDPTAYSKLTLNPNYLLSTSQLFYTGSDDLAYETWRVNLAYAGPMMQGIASVDGVIGTAGNLYALNEAWSSAYFSAWGSLAAYPQQVKTIVELLEFTRDNPEYVNLHQVARIMKALIFQRLTDIYGDVPYFEAGLAYYGGSKFPQYDKQEEIYASLIEDVRDAVSSLGSGTDAVTGDQFYSGDIEKWKRFGNSLLLRLGMRLVEIQPATAEAIAKEVNGKTFQSNADNALLKHSIDGHRVTKNRNSQILSPQGEGGNSQLTKWSKTFIDFLDNNNDPRLSKIAVVNAFDFTESDGAVTWRGWAPESDWNQDPEDQKGMANGKLNNDEANYGFYDGVAEDDVQRAEYLNSFSAINPKMLKLDGVTFIMTYAESELLLADAAQRGWITDASTHYNNGVIAAITCIEQFDATMAVPVNEAEDYLAANPYDGTLAQINTQYWAHTVSVLDFIEAWSNWRRSEFPILPTPDLKEPGDSGGEIPRRMVYPYAEEAENPIGYTEAVSRLETGNTLSGRVWWDVN